MQLSISLSINIVEILQKRETTEADEIELEAFFEKDVPLFVYNRALSKIKEENEKTRKWIPDLEI